MKNEAKTETNRPHVDYAQTIKPQMVDPTNIINTENHKPPHFYISKETPKRAPRLKTTDTTKPTVTSQTIRAIQETEDQLQMPSPWCHTSCPFS